MSFENCTALKGRKRGYLRELLISRAKLVGIRLKIKTQIPSNPLSDIISKPHAENCYWYLNTFSANKINKVLNCSYLSHLINSTKHSASVEYVIKGLW